MSAIEITLIAVVVVLILLFLLYRFTRKMFQQYLTTKPTDFDVLDAYSDGVPFVLVGDSLTDFFPVREFAPRALLLNRGVASETTKDVIERLGEVVALSPKRAVLQIGINDLIRKGKYRLKPDTLTDRILSIAEELRKNGARVTVISLYPVNRKRKWWSFACLKRANNRRIRAVNAKLSEACAARGIPYLDVHSRLTDGKGNLRKEFTIEGLHLTIEGYREVFEAIKDVLPDSSESERQA